jgi:uncharacterized membrane protein
MRRSAPTSVATVAGLCAAVIELLPAGNPARAIAALLLVLVLPGVALLGASGASRPPTPIEGRVWETGLSIGATILVTLALYAVGVKLDLSSWTLALTALTALTCAVWTIRAPANTRSFRFRRPPAPALRKLALLAAALMLMGGAAAVTVNSVSRTDAASHFTQLWILPATATHGDVRIGIYNHEGHDQTYAVEVRRGDRELLALPAVRVRAHTSWTRLVSVPAGGRRVDVKLQLGSAAAATYREVYLSPGSVSSSQP